MRRSSCPRSLELALAALACACATAPANELASAAPSLTFAFSHDNSVAERWPFGLDAITTKFVAEPARAEALSESYWIVRSSAPYAGELSAEFTVRAEFPGTRFEPVAGVDFELVTGVDRNGATTSGAAGMFEVRAPASAVARQAGFAIRARFPGDDARQEPPKPLLVELVRIRDAEGRELELGAARIARWLIIDPDSSPVREPAAGQ